MIRIASKIAFPLTLMFFISQKAFSQTAPDFSKLSLGGGVPSLNNGMFSMGSGLIAIELIAAIALPTILGMILPKKKDTRRRYYYYKGNRKVYYYKKSYYKKSYGSYGKGRYRESKEARQWHLYNEQ
jgi:hypothetical protein